MPRVRSLSFCHCIFTIRYGRKIGVYGLMAAACAAGARAQSVAGPLVAASSQTRTQTQRVVFDEARAVSDASSSALLVGTSAERDEPLPEAPAPQLATEPQPKRGTDPSEHIARKNTMTIPSDWHAQRLTPGQKVKAGLEDCYGVQSLASRVLAAGWEQLLNGEPNYGTDKGAFGQRLGAAAIRGTSQNIFTDFVLAPILHQDARYYVEGPKYGPVHRTVYAVTRVFVTRTDGGESTANSSLLLGYAAAAALTPTYYPQINRNFHDVASVYGGSLGGAALGFFVTEFSQDALRALHLNGKS